MDRDQFARRQAEMTARWYEGVVRQHGDVQAYIETRKRAYLDRWREALRFVAPGSRLLDIGGGNMFATLFELLKSWKIDYIYQDVDPGAVEASQAGGSRFGFEPERFHCALNDTLAFDDSSFDAVFSSHCIEHSVDLSVTLREVRRVLRPEGMFLMAVPLGWEENPEHPYFFLSDHWIALIEDEGFEVRIAQVGREYPEAGYDLFIAARKKAGTPAAPRISPERYCKTALQFIRHDDSHIRYIGSAEAVDGATICRGDWHIELTLHSTVSRALPIFERHPWSGIVSICSGKQTAMCDLHSWYSVPQPVQFDLSQPQSSPSIVITPLGSSDIARAAEGVLRGFLLQQG